ncbi:pilus assembly protein PilP [Desulfonatronovibrio magnus]|uniref:pilus assembly protein PilP n=1 Tax=Desulfonatronovibrio magnus TaxID=698827 RepID=UPI0006963489|nr:pilus assembly protein PilP [Desulfonatronovibrio magnus]RQD63912.1 MAG: hypothetical protein D5R98_05105 [Desulfonatronovibrio sp. MSAO_Bac4]
MLRQAVPMALIAYLTLVAPAGAQNDHTPEDWDYPDWMAPAPYIYEPRPGVDPFTPFIRQRIEEEAVRQQDEEPPRPLTPLERVEISQLKLVGIIWRDDPLFNPKAMVEMPDGKGLIIQTGTRVGRNRGEVVMILPQEVIVSETVTTMFGETETRNTTLKLRPGQDN